MADPATNTAVGTTAGLVTLGSLNQIFGLPVLGVPLGNFFVFTALSVFGAFSYQFVKAQVAREDAASKGVVTADRPKIDLTTLAYSMAAAPLATGLMLYIIQVFGGMNDLYSIGGFYAAGALGPQLVPAVFSMMTKLLSGLGPAKGPKP